VNSRLFRHELLSTPGNHRVEAIVDSREVECLVPVSDPESFDDTCDDGNCWHHIDGWPEWRTAPAHDDDRWSLGQYLSQPDVPGRPLDPQSEVIRRLAGFPVGTAEVEYSPHSNHPLLSWLRTRAVGLNTTAVSNVD